MDWQQAVSILLVAAAAAFLLVTRLRGGDGPSCGSGCSSCGPGDGKRARGRP